MLFILVLAGAPSAFADSSEMQVYGLDIADQGETNLEINSHVSKASSHSELKGRTIFQSLVEVAYGVADHWEAGIKLPMSRVDSNWYGNGVVGELKYVAPHSAEGGYWGAEIELGRTSPFHEKRQWGLEIVPIVGYRAGHWHVTGNPGVSIASDGDDRGVVQFEPSARIGYQLAQKDMLSLEYFIEAGPLKSLLPHNQRNEIAMLAWDTRIGKSMINLGVGRGTTAVSERWVAKFNIDIEFD